MLADLLYLVTPIIYEPKTTFMKKLFFIMLASTLVLSISSCIGGDESAGGTTFNPDDTISKAMAQAMYAHYMDSTVDKSDSAIIRQIFPSVSSLTQVLKVKNLTGIKFIVGAYLATDSVVSRRNQPMVMLQLKTEKGGDITYQYYDLNSVSKEFAPAPPYCPPPPACTMELEG
jgi:hypothetical protein